MGLAYAECPLDVRESLAAQYLVDAIRDEDPQHSTSQVSQKGVLVVATLVVLKREDLPVRVLNLKNKPKIVDKGTVIATREPMVDIVARPQEFFEAQHLL
ncbi:hypothetical protein AVEN_172029-1 [Araneus ventricosus]|uniref:Uncharacterized protein n=1 Tax=Araneus ventricosus TaxID=182803 RepID=A0A4Y2U229_ARAVE|nr:hypothetical protein AVEN_172029-1 [Araneus ventricosus]